MWFNVNDIILRKMFDVFFFFPTMCKRCSANDGLPRQQNKHLSLLLR